jgi:hypothetical protein
MESPEVFRGLGMLNGRLWRRIRRLSCIVSNTCLIFFASHGIEHGYDARLILSYGLDPIGTDNRMRYWKAEKKRPYLSSKEVIQV